MRRSRPHPAASLSCLWLVVVLALPACTSGTATLPAQRTPATQPAFVYLGTGGAASDDSPASHAIVALDVATGAIHWQYGSYASALAFSTAPCVSDGVAFAGTTANDVVAVAIATGQMKWRWHASTTHLIPTMRLACADGIVLAIPGRYFLNSSGGTGYGSDRLWALDALTGRVLWSTIPPPDFESISAPVVGNGIVYVT
ncbi:MAG TPA: hypothetical protein VF807_10625, partial [Ktedonobacterales bacterium]